MEELAEPADEALELVEAEHLVYPVCQVEDRLALDDVAWVEALGPGGRCGRVCGFVLRKYVLVVWVEPRRERGECLDTLPGEVSGKRHLESSGSQEGIKV